MRCTVSTLAIAFSLALSGPVIAQVNGSGGGHFSTNGSHASSSGMSGGSGTGTGGSATGHEFPGSTSSGEAARHDPPSPDGVGAAGTTQTQPGRVLPPAATGPN